MKLRALLPTSLSEAYLSTGSPWLTLASSLPPSGRTQHIAWPVVQIGGQGIRAQSSKAQIVVLKSILPSSLREKAPLSVRTMTYPLEQVHARQKHCLRVQNPMICLCYTFVRMPQIMNTVGRCHSKLICHLLNTAESLPTVFRTRWRAWLNIVRPQLPLPFVISLVK